MSFQQDCVRFGDELAQLVDGGVLVKDAATELGLPRDRCYAILRAIGLPAGQSRGKRRGAADHAVIVSVFDNTGSINQAAKACQVSHSAARRILVAQGLVPSEKLRPRGKSEAKLHFDELMAQGWSTARAAREVGVHPRTGRDWRKGIRKVGNTRVHPDGRVVDYRRGSVYTQTVTSAICETVVSPAVSDRYLSIAARIGKNVSTVSREVRRHSNTGRYLPYWAARTAAAARARPKQAKLVTNAVLRAAV